VIPIIAAIPPTKSISSPERVRLTLTILPLTKPRANNPINAKMTEIKPASGKGKNIIGRVGISPARRYETSIINPPATKFEVVRLSLSSW